MRITPERSRAIFGHPDPPQTVRERQFDYNDEALRRMARTHWRHIPDSDLWYYLHDLAYVELQPELFRYLFPVCLNFWYATLMRNQGACRGDADFHYGLVHGNVLNKMLSDHEREQVDAFFRDGFIDRVDAERGFVYNYSRSPAYGWIMRLNSIGLVAPLIEEIWTEWWRLDSPGCAVSAIMWATGLIYPKGENPIFLEATFELGGGGPFLTDSDSDIYTQGWLDQNLEFLRGTLSAPYVVNKMREAADRLEGEPESAMADRVAVDAAGRADLISLRIADLTRQLATWGSDAVWHG